MYVYDEECLKVFLKKQEQLFDEPVAESLEEADEFLDDCMAVVVDSLDEVREYFEENGADISDMSDEELEEASEVFALPSGRYLIVEGQSDRGQWPRFFCYFTNVRSTNTKQRNMYAVHGKNIEIIQKKLYNILQKIRITIWRKQA